MTFHTRTSSRGHHRLYFMAGIFQRPGSICIFKTLLMAWENCIFPVFLGTTLLTSSPTQQGLCLCTLRSQKVPHQGQSKPSPHQKSSGGPGRPERAPGRVWQRWPQLWLAGQHEAGTPIH